MVVGYLDDHYVLLDTTGTVVTVLAPGMMFEIWMGGEWQAVRLESGGYRGCYYVTSGGERGRLALCMRARLCEADAAPGEQEEVSLPLEQLRLVWVGKQVQRFTVVDNSDFSPNRLTALSTLLILERQGAHHAPHFKQ
jgi:Domain of unknown function (DUF5348)